MTKQGQLSERNGQIFLEDNKDYFSELTIFDQVAIRDICKQFKDVPLDDLIRYTYLHYPFFAIKSTIARKMLMPDELARVDLQKRHFDNKKLFTIGYEGKSLERYLNFLIINDVRVLCDVRKNAYSQKYDALFDYYEENTLPLNWDSLLKVREIIDQEGRVALTCFEQNPKQCHRSRVAKALMSLEDINYGFDNIL